MASTRKMQMNRTDSDSVLQLLSQRSPSPGLILFIRSVIALCKDQLQNGARKMSGSNLGNRRRIIEDMWEVGKVPNSATAAIRAVISPH